MDQLPYELIDFIYQYIDDYDLLFVLRLVGGKLRRALSLCRKLDASLLLYFAYDYTLEVSIITRTFTSLIELEINLGRGVDGDTYSAIGSMRLLQKLVMDGTNVTDSALKEICIGLSSTLQKLHLNRCKEISSDGFLILGQLRKLSVLDASQTKIDDRGLGAISRHTIKILSLSMCDAISGRGLGSLTSIQQLWLRCTNMDDTGVVSICRSNTLRYLDLGWCTQISEDALCMLESLPVLERLGLDGTNIRDRALKRICQGSSRTHLWGISMVYCDGITDMGVEYLKLLPSLRKWATRNYLLIGNSMWLWTKCDPRKTS